MLTASITINYHIIPQVICECEMWNIWACSKHWKHNVTMQTTAEFASDSSANIKLSKHLSFFLLTSNKFFTKTKNVAAKKISGGVAALKVSRKLTCYSWFRNVASCKTQISVGEQSWKSQLIKVTNLGKPPRMFSLACNLLISRKKN